MSREITLFIGTSLDGFIAKENGDLRWLKETEGEGDTVAFTKKKWEQEGSKFGK
ncbi:hypothetical protein [Lysinibacillus pakistanensis]|uniref:hypothetical protein n=1 Tax=Lysinibacillus pakistanensis TaxID=759811 RepID=UPI0034E39A07